MSAERKEQLRVFAVAFIITFITAAFLLALYWVNLKAEDKGFDGYKNPVSVEKLDDLHYLISFKTARREIDLTSVNDAAGYFQAAERWIVPQDVRILSRVCVFTAERFKDSRKEIREQEFYKNAGLV